MIILEIIGEFLVRFFVEIIFQGIIMNVFSFFKKAYKYVTIFKK